MTSPSPSLVTMPGAGSAPAAPAPRPVRPVRTEPKLLCRAVLSSIEAEEKGDDAMAPLEPFLTSGDAALLHEEA